MGRRGLLVALAGIPLGWTIGSRSGSLDAVVLATPALVAGAWWVVRTCGGGQPLRRPTFVGVAFLAIAVTHYLPSLGFLERADMRYALKFHLLVTASLCALALGAFFGTLTTRLRSSEITDGYHRFYGATRADQRFVRRLGWVCTGLVVIYVMLVPVWPLFRLVVGSGSTSQINALRRLVIGPEMGPLWPLFGFMRAALVPLLFVLVYLAYTHASTGRLRLGGFAAVALIYNSWAAAKTPVVALFVLVMLAALVQQGRRVRGVLTGQKSVRRARTVLAAATVVVVAYPLLIFSMKAFGADRPLTSVLGEGIVTRLVGAPAQLSYAQLELIPRHIPHTNFRDISLYARLTGQPQVTLSSITAAYVAGDDRSNAPPAAVGTLWAQGGTPYVVLGFLLFGFLLQCLQAWTVRRLPSSEVSVAFVALFLWLSFRTGMTALHSLFIFDGGIPLVLLALWWIRSRRPIKVRVPMLQDVRS